MFLQLELVSILKLEIFPLLLASVKMIKYH